MRDDTRPRAKREGLLTEDLDGEVIVYDEARHRGACLNRTAALVWRHADGVRTVGELAAILRAELDPVADENLVWHALDRLNAERLLDEPLTRSADEARASRRQFVAKIGLVGVATLLLPVVTSVAPPREAQATPVCSSGSSGGAAALPVERLRRG